MILQILDPDQTTFDVVVDPLAVVDVSMDGSPEAPVTADGDGLAEIPVPDGALLVSTDLDVPEVFFYSQYVVPDPVELGPDWGLSSTSTASIMADLRALTIAINNATSGSLSAVNVLQFRLSPAYWDRGQDPFAPGEVMTILQYHEQVYGMATYSIIRDVDVTTPIVRYFDTRGNVLVVQDSTIA